MPFLDYIDGLESNSVKIIKLKSGEYLKDVINKV